MASTIVKVRQGGALCQAQGDAARRDRRQKKSFGLIIADISGGQTNTTTYDFQAFKGMPRIVYGWTPRPARKPWHVGWSSWGTPIGSLNRILAASDSSAVFNGYCGAESGYVPVSTAAPAC